MSDHMSYHMTITLQHRADLWHAHDISMYILHTNWHSFKLKPQWTISHVQAVVGMSFLPLVHIGGCMVCCHGRWSLLGGVPLGHDFGASLDSRMPDSGQRHSCSAGLKSPHGSLSQCNVVLHHMLWPGESDDFYSIQMTQECRKSQRTLVELLSKLYRRDVPEMRSDLWRFGLSGESICDHVTLP